MAIPWLNTQSDLLPTEHYPWIVFPYDDHNINQLFCSLSHPHKMFHKSIPELNGVVQIVARCSDWLLLSKGETDTPYCLWNPTNSKLIALPPLTLKQNSELISWGMTSPPSGGDPRSCMVLLFDKAHKSIIFIRPDAEDKRWIELPYEQLIRDIGVAADGDANDFLEHCVTCNGKIYSMSFRLSKLVTINVDNDDHLVIECLPCPRPHSTTFAVRVRKFLAELGGKLFLIGVFYGGTLIDTDEVIDVHVFKMDFASMVWRIAKDLMGGNIFFDGFHVASCEAAHGNDVERDNIYFTLPQDMGWFNCFNLKECHLQVNLPCPVLPSTCGYPMFFPPPSNVTLSSNHKQVENKPCKERQAEKCSVKVVQKEDSPKKSISKVATTKFHDLPMLVVKLIADSLDLFDYILNFRAVSRDCWSAAPPLRKKQALEKLESSPLSPWLLFPTNMNVHNLLDPNHAYRFLMTIPETIMYNQLRCLKHGWMMMSDCDDFVSFYNPFTKAAIGLEVPSEISRGFASSYIMSFSTLPTSTGCIVAGFDESFINGITAMLAVIGRDGHIEWYNFWLEVQFLMAQSAPIFRDGAFYALGLDGDLLVFRCEGEAIQEENVHWYILDNKIPAGESGHQAYILEWDGIIASVFVGQMGKWVRVFKLSTTTLDWESVESLGDHTFFISRSSCAAIEGRSLGMQNRIYFPRVHGNKILYYSMETRKFHYDREDYLDDFHNTKEQLRVGWIDPKHFQSS